MHQKAVKKAVPVEGGVQKLDQGAEERPVFQKMGKHHHRWGHSLLGAPDGGILLVFAKNHFTGPVSDSPQWLITQ